MEVQHGPTASHKADQPLEIPAGCVLENARGQGWVMSAGCDSADPEAIPVSLEARGAVQQAIANGAGFLHGVICQPLHLTYRFKALTERHAHRCFLDQLPGNTFACGLTTQKRFET